jgi:ribosomal protein L11 methyltransferase
VIEIEKRSQLWYALEVAAETNAREAVEYALMEAGALGTEVKDSHDNRYRITGYFETVPDRERVRSELLDALRIYNLPSTVMTEMSVREVADEDWLADWKKGWQPVEAGRFIIAPPWSEISSAGDRILIRIEPGMAFGTGTHETTRLCLAAIEKYFGGGSFLDVGTGTGILAIAAAKLFPEAQVYACDTDLAAVAIAHENAKLNQLENRITFFTGSLEVTTPSANFIAANLTAKTILEILPALVSATCGRLLLSGILREQQELILTGLEAQGLSAPFDISEDGDWLAIVA